jgi:hypothetical protein
MMYYGPMMYLSCRTNHELHNIDTSLWKKTNQLHELLRSPVHCLCPKKNKTKKQKKKKKTNKKKHAFDKVQEVQLPNVQYLRSNVVMVELWAKAAAISPYTFNTNIGQF